MRRYISHHYYIYYFDITKFSCSQIILHAVSMEYITDLSSASSNLSLSFLSPVTAIAGLHHLFFILYTGITQFSTPVFQTHSYTATQHTHTHTHTLTTQSETYSYTVTQLTHTHTYTYSHSLHTHIVQPSHFGGNCSASRTNLDRDVVLHFRKKM